VQKARGLSDEARDDEVREDPARVPAIRLEHITTHVAWSRFKSRRARTRTLWLSRVTAKNSRIQDNKYLTRECGADIGPRNRTWRIARPGRFNPRAEAAFFASSKLGFLYRLQLSGWNQRLRPPV